MTDADQDKRLHRIYELAIKQWPNEEIDLDAPSEQAVSEGDDNGCYYRAWVWVDYSETDLDKEKECRNCGEPTIAGGDGWDGLCANCADVAARQEQA